MVAEQEQDWRTDFAWMAVVMEDGRATLAAVAREHVLGHYDLERLYYRETEWRYRLVGLDTVNGTQPEIAQHVARRVAEFGQTRGKKPRVVLDVTRVGTEALRAFRAQPIEVLAGATIGYEVEGAISHVWGEIVGVLRTWTEVGRFTPAPEVGQAAPALANAMWRELKLAAGAVVGSDPKLTAGALALYWVAKHRPLMVA
jgi:hypothetical protein